MDYRQAEKLLLYKVIVGSRAYGLDLASSDTDIRGIYMQPNEFLLGNGYCEQVSADKNDIVYYELNRFINLLAKSNPNVIEWLWIPENLVLLKDPKMDFLIENRYKFLSKLCKYTFGGYALSQIKKATGLNKKINIPLEKDRKTPIDFCYFIDKESGHSVPLKEYLHINNMNQQNCGLAKISNGVQLYKLYYDPHSLNYNGIERDNSNDVCLSEIPKNEPLMGFIYFNLNGYSVYCREYKEYWEWVENRNPIRYSDNTSHDNKYDGKNFMHCLRLLDMAIEVAEGKGIILNRPNRDFLLSIRMGKVPYKDIMEIIKLKEELMNNAFDRSSLPDHVDPGFIHNTILRFRV